MKKNKQIYLILHNIRSTYNVGAIFRTAEAAGISKIFLSGYTPTPLDRFGKKRSDIKKTALGAENIIPWEYGKQITKIIKNLKAGGFKILALEQDPKSIDYKKIKIKNKTAIILGTETTGIKKEILVKCDQIAEIPMQGKKESLNVSVATGILLFRILGI